MLIPITNIVIAFELNDIAYQSSDTRNKLKTVFYLFVYAGDDRRGVPFV